ncbi:MAG TPA: response regulator [Chthoniobacterales bacterium]
MPHIGLGPIPATASAGLPATDGRKARVLVVDDEPALLNVLALLIRRSGCEVLTARDAAEAWTCVEREGEGLDGMFTDVFMPGEIDGVALAAKVHNARPSLPVVLVTGWPEKLDSNTRKVHAVLDKPFNAQRLATALATVLKPAVKP